MIAGAIATTAAALRERIVAIAAHKLEAAPDDIELAGSRATVRGTPTIGLSLAEIADIAYSRLGVAAARRCRRGSRPAAGTRPSAPMTWANATHVCTCEVDLATGAVTLLRYIVSEDCGPMINPNVVEGQIDGGTVQGIGGALLEHLAYDEDGNPVATTFIDYLLPTMAEIPVIEHVHLETPGPGPGRLQGCRRRRRHRRAAGGRQRRRRRPRPVRRRDHPPAGDTRVARRAARRGGGDHELMTRVPR